MKNLEMTLMKQFFYSNFEFSVFLCEEVCTTTKWNKLDFHKNKSELGI